MSGKFAQFRRPRDRRRTALERWARLMALLYPGPATDVAEHFGTDASTIRRWRKGEHVPTGEAVIQALEEHPEITLAILGR